MVKDNDAIKTIEEYYSSTARDYSFLWDKRNIHFGYRDGNTTGHIDSLNNMNRQVALLARLRASARVLDAGCGVGGLSLWLADKYGAEVDGITVCAEQVESARQFAEQDNLNERTAFHQMDYTCTDFQDDAFDAVVAIESVCYAKDKGALFDFLLS